MTDPFGNRLELMERERREVTEIEDDVKWVFVALLAVQAHSPRRTCSPG